MKTEQQFAIECFEEIAKLNPPLAYEYYLSLHGKYQLITAAYGEAIERVKELESMVDFLKGERLLSDWTVQELNETNTELRKENNLLRRRLVERR